MTNTVRIMPLQPIEAQPPMFPDAWERPVWCIPDCDGDSVAVSQADWMEMSDPIMWDGTDEAHDAIVAALRPLGVTILFDDIDADELDQPMPALQLRSVHSKFPTVGFIPPMCSIQQTPGGPVPFVILPPEATA